MTEYTTDDLVPVGKLTTVREDGFIRFVCEELPDEVTEVFLIFPDDRVFLVTIRDRKSFGGKEYIAFEEPEVPEEVRQVRQVRVCLAPEALPEDDDDVMGWVVTDGGTLLGEVTDVFYNGAHLVLEVRLQDGGDVLLPDVADWIAARDEQARTLIVPRLRELTEV